MSNISLPNDDDLIRIKLEQENNDAKKITEFRNELVKRLNNEVIRYSLRDIANLLVYNSKEMLDREFFNADEVCSIIDELFLEYIKNKEGD